MLSQQMTYYRPETIREAVDLYHQLIGEHKTPIFYGGGSEILTRARLNDIHFDAVIDLKSIPELRVHDRNGDRLEFGAGLHLTEIRDHNLWPLLTATADRIADHTTRSHITLGGNLLSMLPYREAILPFLLMNDAKVRVASRDGVQTRNLDDIFDETIHLKPGEFLVSVSVSGQEAHAMAYRSYKMTRQDWIDYPLVTIAMVRRDNGSMRAAFSGWTRFPFVSSEVNHILSDRRKSSEERAEHAVQNMPVPALDDIHGSREYREFVTRYTLANMLSELEETS